MFFVYLDDLENAVASYDIKVTDDWFCCSSTAFVVDSTFVYIKVSNFANDLDTGLLIVLSC